LELNNEGAQTNIVKWRGSRVEQQMHTKYT
jgi:hypothetical protein